MFNFNEEALKVDRQGIESNYLVSVLEINTHQEGQ